MNTAQPIDAEDYDTGDCFMCWNRGCRFCCPCKDEPMPARDFGIDPFEGTDDLMDTVELSEAEMVAIGREVHARVLRGELDAEFVYGSVGYDQANQQGGRVMMWHPIETAPKDNKHLLLLAEFHNGQLVSVDFDGGWDCESESWELPQKYYFWSSANGLVDEPTHWAYQPDDFNRLTPKED